MFVIADAAGFLRLFSGATGAVLFSTRVLSPAAVQDGDKFLALSFSGTGSTQVHLPVEIRDLCYSDPDRVFPCG